MCITVNQPIKANVIMLKNGFQAISENFAQIGVRIRRLFIAEFKPNRAIIFHTVERTQPHMAKMLTLAFARERRKQFFNIIKLVWRNRKQFHLRRCRLSSIESAVKFHRTLHHHCTCICHRLLTFGKIGIALKFPVHHQASLHCRIG